MKPSLLELVDVILKQLQDQPERFPTEHRLRNWLAGQGYAKGDIDAAMKLVKPRLRQAGRSERRLPGRVRQLSPYETFKLSAEARAALARLEVYELLDPSEREMVLERLDHFEGEIGLEELDYLVSWIVCSNRDVENQQTIYNVMEGKGTTLH